MYSETNGFKITQITNLYFPFDIFLSIENVFSVFHDCLLIKFKYYYLHVVAMTHHCNMPSICR